jgi:beta-lactamase regulating signal transducer with metallopeptidase domain
MHSLPEFILKLSLSLSVVYLFYYFILRKLTFYNHNRWYLLGYTLLSFAIPCMNITSVLQKNNWHSSELITWVPVIDNAPSAALTASAPAAWGTWNVVAAIIAAGILVMLSRLVLQLFSFRKMLQKAEAVSANGMNLYQVNENIIPFSFGNSIFINRHLHAESELQEIIRHEFVHVKQKHSIDIIWSEILCMLNWYNPFVWLLKKAIRQNLEFIADRKVLENGLNKKEYQYLLLKVIGNNQYSIATQFNFSSLKKRIAMMNKTKSAKRQLIRLFFYSPPLLFCCLHSAVSGMQQLQQLPAMKKLRQ